MFNRTTIQTPEDTLREREFHSRAALAAILRRAIRVDSFHSPAGTFNLALVNCKEVFNRKEIKLPDEIKAQFVKEVAPLIGNLLMKSRNDLSRLVSIRSAALTSRHLPLCDSEPTSRRTKELRVLDLLTSAEGCKVLNTNIDAYGLPSLGNPMREGLVNQQNGEPTISLSFDCDVPNLALDGTRETKANRTEFRERKPVAVQFESAPSICERVISRPGFESRKAGFLSLQTPLKEYVISTTNTAQALFKYHCIEPAQIWALCSNILKLCALRKVIDRLATNPIGVPSLLKGRIIEFAAKIKHLLELRSNMFRRSLYFELIRFQCALLYRIATVSAKDSWG